ncbi:hypothetical protein LZ31DRAFT_205360 [Colletotrichum somersetense]|nr:hypothetical protein LZ31DRAFT_205360 [Colletotrichum somersetense]
MDSSWKSQTELARWHTPHNSRRRPTIIALHCLEDGTRAPRGDLASAITGFLYFPFPFPILSVCLFVCYRNFPFRSILSFLSLSPSAINKLVFANGRIPNNLNAPQPIWHCPIRLMCVYIWR